MRVLQKEKKYLTLRLHIARGVSIWGNEGRVQTYYKRVYPALVLGLLKCGNFEIRVENEATIGAFRSMIYLCYASVETTLLNLLYISYSVRLRVARSTQMGKCHSLNKRDE